MLRLDWMSIVLLSSYTAVQASIDPATLLAGVKKKYDLVRDYTASAQLKTNVLFIKAPLSQVTGWGLAIMRLLQRGMLW